MTYGKIWLVVNPSVGLPVFFFTFALTALAIHATLFADGRLKAFWSDGVVAKVAVVQVQAPAPAAEAK
jgi:light-harvesting protein B-800-850 alpha chain